MTIGQTWREVQRRLEDAGVGPAPREGQRLARRVLGWEALRLVSEAGNPFPAEKLAELEALTARRTAGEPLAYVLGVAGFWSREWTVGPQVLIPRPDTEVLVEAVLAVLPVDSTARVAEVGVGSGAVVGSILLERPLVTAVGTDVSAPALAVAEANWAAAGVAARITAVETDLLAGVDGVFEVILSNPPYIPEDEYLALEDGVRGHEPALALQGGVDGLGVYRRLIPEAAEKLTDGGWLALEIGQRQGAEVMALLASWDSVRVLSDLAGRDRVVVARMKSRR